MKNRRLQVHRFFTFVLLWVFSLAITPWSALHRHAEMHTVVAEEHCTHKFHVKASEENCLVCKVHFEKNYTLITHQSPLFLQSVSLHHLVISPSTAYTTLISTSLRGPPAIIS